MSLLKGGTGISGVQAAILAKQKAAQVNNNPPVPQTSVRPTPVSSPALPEEDGAPIPDFLVQPWERNENAISMPTLESDPSKPGDPPPEDPNKQTTEPPEEKPPQQQPPEDPNKEETTDPPDPALQQEYEVTLNGQKEKRSLEWLIQNAESPIEDRVFEVPIPGEENPRQLTYRELVGSYMGRDLLTQKRQQESTAHREAMEAVTIQRTELKSKLEVLEGTLKKLTFDTEPDWAAIAKQYTPEQYEQIRSQYESQKKLVASVQDEIKEQNEQGQKDEQTFLESYKVQETELLLIRMPEWRDDTVRTEEFGKLFEFGKTLGFSDDEMNQIYDHRMVLLLKAAFDGHELQERATSLLASAAEEQGTVTDPNQPPANPDLVLEPGARATPAPPPSEPIKGSDTAYAAYSKAMSSGDADDVAAAIGHMLDVPGFVTDEELAQG